MLDKLKKIVLAFIKDRPSLKSALYVVRFRRNFLPNKKKINGKHNSISLNRAILNGVRFDIIGEHNKIFIDTMAILDSVTFYVRGSGNRVMIGAECRITNSTIWIEDNACEVSIGRETTVGGIHLAATEDNSKVLIGNDCMLAYDIDIRTGDSHGIYDEKGNRINKALDVIIGDHVWVAAHTVILKGASIGSGAVVATGALVTNGAYPGNCVLAGNPAKPVKLGIKWSRSRRD